MTPGPPVRVLHVLASLGVGGVETYLMNMLRSMDPARHRFDFLLNEGGRRWFDDEAEARGATLHRGPSPHRPVAYARHLRRVLAAGDYDAVHSHLYLYSGIVVRVARRAGVRIRVAHAHTFRPPPRTWRRRGYEAAMRRLLLANATAGLAPTAACAAGMFGPRWRDDERVRIMPMGFEFGAYAAPPDPIAARAELGIPPGRRVLAHIGGFSPQKNHGYLFDVFAALRAARDDVHLLVLTREPGPVAGELAARGLAGDATVAPTETPAARALAATDVFVLPSLWEGLPVVALEAQAAAVPLLGSSAVPDEAVVIPELVTRLDLSAGPAAWAAAAARLLDEPPAPAEDAAAAVMARYGVGRAWDELADVYAGA